MSSLLRIEALICGYGPKRPVLKGLFLDVPEHRVVGLLGRNGSGKSTLFKCLTTYRDYQGGLFFRDAFLESQLRHRHVAYMAQDSFLPVDLKVGRVIGMFGTGASALIQADTRIQSLLDRRVGALSSGERRYLEFCLVMAQDKPLTILDEPFSQVEPLYTELMFDRIRKRQAGNSLLIADHNYGNVKDICDELHLLVDGRLVSGDQEATLSRLGYLPHSVAERL
jgi:ABC-type multidrug transport system ATPase subunit